MDKGNYNAQEDDKYQCPETGAHFEHLDMVRRLKSLKTRRDIIDKVIEDEETKKALLKGAEIETHKIYEEKFQ